MLVTVLLVLAGIYGVGGSVFALAFVVRGAAALDDAARGASFGFRVVIFPGAVVLWPLLLARWFRRRNVT
jgi:hypothetical protein